MNLLQDVHRKEISSTTSDENTIAKIVCLVSSGSSPSGSIVLFDNEMVGYAHEPWTQQRKVKKILYILIILNLDRLYFARSENLHYCQNHRDILATLQ